MKRIISALAFFAIVFLSSCAPARVGVGVSVSPRPGYYGPRPYYRPYPYYNPYYYGHRRTWGRPHHYTYYHHY